MVLSDDFSGAHDNIHSYRDRHDAESHPQGERIDFFREKRPEPCEEEKRHGYDKRGLDVDAAVPVILERGSQADRGKGTVPSMLAPSGDFHGPKIR